MLQKDIEITTDETMDVGTGMSSCVFETEQAISKVEKYIVEYEGNRYACTPTVYTEHDDFDLGSIDGEQILSVALIGNLSFADFGDDTSEPFLLVQRITATKKSNWLITREPVGSIINFGVYKEPVVHKLNPKYLPEGGFGYTEREALIEETEIVLDDKSMWIGTPCGIKTGETYEVNVDGGIYQCICLSATNESMAGVILGNASLLDENADNNGMPFLYAEVKSPVDAAIFVTTLDGTNHILSIFHTSKVSKIDSKFLPKIKIDYSESNLLADGYISNRPAYESTINVTAEDLSVYDGVVAKVLEYNTYYNYYKVADYVPAGEWLYDGLINGKKIRDRYHVSSPSNFRNATWCVGDMNFDYIIAYDKPIESDYASVPEAGIYTITPVTLHIRKTLDSSLLNVQWNDIKDRPFGVLAGKVITIGSLENADSVTKRETSTHETVEEYYRCYPEEITNQDLIGATLVLNDGSTHIVSEEDFTFYEYDGWDIDGLIAGNRYINADVINTEYYIDFIESTGLYVADNVTEIRFPDIEKQLDVQYIPDSIARVDDAYGAASTAEANAKAHTDAEVAKVQGDVDALGSYVGTIPESSDATNIIAYIQEKTADIATDTTFKELDSRVTQAEIDIDNIEKDYLKDVDKTDLQGKITDVGNAIDTEKSRAEDIEAGLQSAIDAINHAETGILKQAKDYADGKDEAIANAQKAGDDAMAEAKTKVASVVAADASITVASTAVAPTVAVKVSADADNAMELVADGLKVVIPATAEYSIVKAADSGDYAAVYNLTKDGAVVGVSINIPKDIVVKSGSVVGDEIVLVLNDEDATEIKIPVASLIEYVTSGSQTGDMVVVNVSNDHKVTATITDGAVTLAKLTTEIQTAIGKAHSHENADVINAITADDVVNWNSAQAAAEATAAADATSKANTAEANAKAYTDTEAGKDRARLEALEAIDHDHTNKAELDKIASGDKAKWDAATAKAHEHGNKTVLDGITAKKIASWDAAEGNAKTYTDNLVAQKSQVQIITWEADD